MNISLAAVGWHRRSAESTGRRRCAPSALLLLCSAAVQAQDPSLGPGNDGAGGTPDLRAGVGLLQVYWPEYPGSDRSESVPLPYFDILYKRRFFINDEYGVGYYVLDGGRSKLGVSVTYLFGRDESASSELRGLGDVEGGAVANVFGSLDHGGLSFGANVYTQVSGEDTGPQLELTTGLDRVYANKLVLSPEVGVTLASARFMQSYFGVTAEQSAASGLSEHDASAGIKSVGAGLGFVHLFSSEWNLVGGVEFERFVGDAADSPAVADENQLTVALGVAYQF